jgi:hypothetical protein
MSLNSSRLPIANSLVYILQNVIDPNTSAALYPLVKLGAVYDPGANTQWVQVTHFQGQAKPAGSGGTGVGWRRDDEVIYLITSGYGPYQSNDSMAQHNMLYAQDILLPALDTHFQLPDANNPTNAVQSVYSVLPIQVDRSLPRTFPNGNVYLLWHVPVIVKQQFNVVLTQP